MDSDIVIAQKAKLLSIEKIAAKIGLAREDLELYGDYKAKIKLKKLKKKPLGFADSGFRRTQQV